MTTTATDIDVAALDAKASELDAQVADAAAHIADAETALDADAILEWRRTHEELTVRAHVARGVLLRALVAEAEADVAAHAPEVDEATHVAYAALDKLRQVQVEQQQAGNAAAHAAAQQNILERRARRRQKALDEYLSGGQL